MDEAKLEAASAIALAVTLFLIFTARPLARRLGLVDKPNERKRHRGRVPLIGGLCFFLGTVVGLSYVGYVDRVIATLMIPSGLIVIVGVLDDMFDLSVKLRLGVQAIAALMVAIGSGLYLDHAGMLFGDQPLMLGVLGIPLSVFGVIGLINAFNMLDGIDGLAGSVTMVAIAAIFLFAGTGGAMAGVLLLLQLLFAAIVPYLCVNLGWPDGRKVFMGDAGSTLIGFLLAWSLIFLSHSTVARLAPVDALWCVAVPVMDTLGVMYRRWRRGVSVFKPDRQHLHHLLLDAGLSPRVALAVIVAMSLSLVALGYALRELPDLLNLLVFASVLAAYVLFFQRGLERARLLVRRDGIEVRPGSVAIDVAVTALDTQPQTLDTPPVQVRALCVVGSSPETIQLAPIARQLEQDGRFETRICVASDAHDVQARVLEMFGIAPDVQVDVRQATSAEVTAEAVEGMKRVLGEIRPDVVVVPGDSPATVAAALAAFAQRIPIARIEPGLPDEPTGARVDAVNRKLSSLLATIHIAPTEHAERRLIETGIPADRVVLARNAASASLRAAVQRIEQDEELRARVMRQFGFLRPSRPVLLVACCGRLINAFTPLYRALARIASQRPDVDIVCSLDDPDLARRSALQREFGNVHMLAPADYLAFACLLDRADILLASSTETVEHVATLGKPVLLIQPEDARLASAASNVVPVRADADGIATHVLTLLSDRSAYQALCLPDGGDDPCRRVADTLASLRPATTADEAGVWAPGLKVAPIAQGVPGSS
ncbi:MAG TPA: UDP-N-acetylglucosamine 2-epimerase [Lysobacter sp.]|nr:UDP-N-acetylglucosamine 2-epimerase [Lysobacter sp.]